MNTKTETCRNCETSHGLERKYPWHCTPKKKHNQAPYWTEFTINLCDVCYQKTINCKSVNGSDWWDAYDDLNYTYIQQQSYRDKYDELTAKVLGFKTVEDLRQVRNDNRLAWEKTKNNKK